MGPNVEGDMIIKRYIMVIVFLHFRTALNFANLFIFVSPDHFSFGGGRLYPTGI